MEKDTKKNSFIRRVMNNIKNMIKNRKIKSLPEGKIETNKEMENASKSADYRKGMALVGAAVATVGVIGVAAAKGKQDLESIDMSNYNIDNAKYMEYAKTDDKDTMYRLAKLDDNVRLYNSLSSEKLTDAQIETFNKVKSEIELEMMSKMTAKLYLNMFKEKMKSAYNAEGVIIDYKSGANPSKEFSVEIQTKTKKFFMDSKDETKEIKSAVWDIVELQKIQDKESYSDKDINVFVKLYENMKGFSNLEFVKEEDKPLTMSETYKTTLADGSYTMYHMDLSDKKNPKVESKTEIEVRNGFVNESEER